MQVFTRPISGLVHWACLGNTKPLEGNTWLMALQWALGNVGMNLVKHKMGSLNIVTNTAIQCGRLEVGSSAFIVLKLTRYYVYVCVFGINRCSYGVWMRPYGDVSQLLACLWAAASQRSEWCWVNMFICCVNNSRAEFMSMCVHAELISQTMCFQKVTAGTGTACSLNLIRYTCD